MAAYDVQGSGLAIVFLHAALGDRRMWHPQVVEFAATNRVVAIDSRGFGDAPPSNEPFNRADDVVAILDELEIDRAVLVGGSMGGRVAAEIAAFHPHRVLGLMLIGAARAGHNWSTQVQELWARENAAADAGDIDKAVAVNLDFWLDGPDRDRAGVTDADRALVAAMQRRAFELERTHPEAVPESHRDGLVDRVCEIEVPTMVLFGTDDPADIEQIARWYANQIPNATLHPIENAAHLPSLEQPAACNRLLHELLGVIIGV